MRSTIVGYCSYDGGHHVYCTRCYQELRDAGALRGTVESYRGITSTVGLVRCAACQAVVRPLTEAEYIMPQVIGIAYEGLALCRPCAWAYVFDYGRVDPAAARFTLITRGHGGACSRCGERLDS